MLKELQIRSKAGVLVAMAAMLAATAGIAVTGIAPAGATVTTTTVVGKGDIASNGPWALQPSSNTGTYSFVAGPATPPGGVGSLAMSIASGNHEWLNNYSYGACATGPSCNNSVANWTLLANIDTLGFSTYRASGSTYPSFNIEVDPTGTGSGSSTFVFVPDPNLVANSTWQTWDGLNPSDGTWYSTATLASPPFNCPFQAAGCSASWSQIQTAYPDARVRYGLGPNVGTGGTFAGNVDNFTVGVSGATTVYDFEPDCTTVCYVNGTTGSNLNTGQANDPLATIQAGINQVTAGGTVNVAPGTYDAATTITKAVTLNGANSGVAGTAARGPESLVELLSGQSGSIFNITTSNPVTIDGFRAQFQGTAQNGGLLLSLAAANNLTFKNNLVDNSTYVNSLVFDDSAATSTFTNNKFSGIGQTGSPGTGVVAAWGTTGGAQAVVSITGNTFSQLTDQDGVPAINLNTVSGNVTGNTFQDIHQYGILLADTLGNLTISGNLFDQIHNDTPTTSASRGSGIRTFAQPNFVGPVTITGNTFSNSFHGVLVADDGSPADISNGNLRVNRNNIATSNTAAGISVAGATVGTLDGTCNWWGQTGGPATGQVEGSVTTTPFLRLSNLAAQCPATVPGAPAPAFAVPFNDHGAEVVWRTPTNNGGAPILGYQIIPYKAGVAQPAHVFNSTATAEFIAGLTDGTSYRFTVAARNAVGYGPPSAQSPAMIAGAPGQPGTPTAVKVASGSLKNTFAAPMNNGAPITSFSVTCISTNGGVTKSKTGTASPITVATLSAGKSYQCRVNATNSRGTGPLSDPSAAVNA